MKTIKLFLILCPAILLHCSDEFPRIDYIPKEDLEPGMDQCKEKEGTYNPDEQYCNPEDGKLYESNCKGVQYEKASSFCDARDGQIYKFKPIGLYIWMAQNLNYNTNTYGAKCYGNNPENCEKYGMLYNWATAMKACPLGWHLSTDEEWANLVQTADMPGSDTPPSYLKANEGWYNNSSGNDYFGFSALPGGWYAGYDNALFEEIERRGSWWTDYEVYNSRAFSRSIFWNSGAVAGADMNKEYFYSVRCVEGS